MKKSLLIASTIIVTSSFAAQAQEVDLSDTLQNHLYETKNAQQHLCFKSIPLCGNREEFIRNLEQSGFTNRSGRCRGLFAGFNVETEVLCTPLSDIVYGVAAKFPPHNNFEGALQDYVLLKTNLEAVYGKPQESTEKFMSPYSLGDGYNLTALNEGKAIYRTVWTNELGTITCLITPADHKSARLVLVYCDKAGEDKSNKEKTIIIQRDL